MSGDSNRFERGQRIWLTDKNPETYNSKVLESFVWREREGSEKYDRGQLIVFFRDTGAYTYNVPFEVFVRLAERAYDHDEFSQTPFDWYDENMIDWVTDEKANDDGLYVEKLVK